MDSPLLQRALISVSDKLGLVDFARGLATAGVQIFSTGGTGRYLEEHGITVHDVAEYTGFPEMMDGRLKTLHPKVFGGILCRHDRPDDMAALVEHQIERFDLIVVNLYPFEETVARNEVTPSEAIEQIDIGGPSLVRAAAKNHSFVTIATHPEQYSAILEQLDAQGGTTLEMRRRLAGDAFTCTAQYDQAISDYFNRLESTDRFPTTFQKSFRRKSILRYGENPHQQAALYSDAPPSGANLVSSRKLHGKELSYNNLLDLDSALVIARSLPLPGVVVVKHNNPCGAASGSSLVEATKKALAGDPVSAFGSILGFNQAVDAAVADHLSTPGLFVEAIVAPNFEPAALEILTSKPKWKNNVRLVQVGTVSNNSHQSECRFIAGGVLVQDANDQPDDESQWNIVTEISPDDEQLQDLRFAWSVVRHVKSNAIVLVRQQSIVGAGAGQMSRVDAVEIAIRKAEERASNSVLASDAFFPFPDSIEQAAQAGIAAIIQPGGSRRDPEVIDACNKHRLPMIFTNARHFKH
ncbi:MAG: bifunctional phosphoribosylaminoimidazolecarboxamide formyltransferase/inosine monophosphate cyclohydrolase [Planctomycetaceae bacterium]|nr:bifunctional phosphoribosylaminoimidazolecarboxamide formyltransferase/inosine monophosphate cyclohydrolase [Planctomycetaceae bacterium]MBP63591.1 bifunctional phosphoribosylaminoimidazolecarboxamide formyltransferase/inosine monophosphate cyclohydrolase [Planctomycetaceae bacterium]